MTITILPNGRNLFATFESLPFKAVQCPRCDMWFTEMSEQADIEAHINRCIERKAEENRKMVAAGYKQTSHGWVLK